MNSRLVFKVIHDDPLPPNLFTGMCQEDGPADVLNGYLQEACGCTDLLLQVLPNASRYFVEPKDGTRYSVHVSDEVVICCVGELDSDFRKGVMLHRRSRHVSFFEGTDKYTREMCERLAKEALNAH